MKTWKWGILGCGKIAATFSRDLKTLPNAELYAVGSRDRAKAQKFATEQGYKNAYGSYLDLVSDPHVDVIYIASPHSHHLEHTLLCLEHGKAVLCEKAFALNSDQVQQMIQKSREKGVFLMEAFWTRFQPAFIELNRILEDEELGKPKMMRSDFAFNGPYDPKNRLYNLDLGGGSLLDIGIYPVFMALQTFGRPDEIKTVASFSDTGSEESIGVLFKYQDGKIASLQSSFAVYTETQSEFWCTNGHVRIARDGIGTTHVNLYPHDKPMINRAFSYEGQKGYHLEAEHLMECLDAGLTESPLLPLAFSSLLMETLDRIRKEAGIYFPIEIK